MDFPSIDRVVYSKPMLAEVICQLRFAPILRIESEPPAGFQDAIRADYPHLLESEPAEFLEEFPEHVRRAVGSLIRQGDARQRYEFRTDDGSWRAILSREAITLVTTSYDRWEGFRERMEQLIRALESQYGPIQYSRIGLRYKNLIDRGQLELGESTWDQLLRPAIASEMADECIAEKDVATLRHRILLRLNTDDLMVTLQHGLTTHEDWEEPRYLIDADYFREGRNDVDGVISILNAANGYAGRLFRWAIDERLHQAMGPQVVRA